MWFSVVLFPTESIARTFLPRLSGDFLDGGSPIDRIQVALKLFHGYHRTEGCKLAEAERNISCMAGVSHDLLIDIIVVNHAVQVAFLGPCIRMTV